MPRNAVQTLLKLPPLPDLRRGARLWLAYSGGLDSSALLHLLATLRLRRLHAVHVHHGLQGSADRWARHCARECRALGVPCTVMRVRIDPQDAAGPESAARTARYAALRSQMKPGDLLITAHHQDDQAETVLLRLLRGTGISGLAAMRELSDFAPGQLWRPLLQTPRNAIHAYAQQHRLRWIEDPHNQIPRYARSFLRSEILPRLQTHWPHAQKSLARAAQNAAEAEELLQGLAEADLEIVGRVSASVTRSHEQALDMVGYASRLTHPTVLSVADLLKLSTARRANVLRHWLALKNLLAPSSSTLARLEQEMLRARPDAQPLLHCETYEFRRYRDALYVMPPLPPAPQQEFEWNGIGTLELPPGCGSLVSSARKALPLMVRFARGGEKLKPQGETHTRSLKNLFQESALPPWQRLRTPLIYRGDELLAVAGRWLTAEWAQELKRRRTRIQWLPAAVTSAPAVSSTRGTP